MHQPPFTTLIIGCGNIGGNFDNIRATELPPLGHAKAFSNHPAFTLSACADPSKDRRDHFCSTWSVPTAATSAQELLHRGKSFDVISICSPTERHREDIEVALSMKPKLVFCEKPITLSVDDSKYCVDQCARSGVLLAVNYSRRWDDRVSQLRDELASGVWGKIRSVTAQYNKGLMNNGSHMVDLLLNIFGDFEITSASKATHDFFDDDPSVPFQGETASGVPISVNVTHAADYSLFEMQIFTEAGIVSMENGGHSWRVRHAEESRLYTGYHAATRETYMEGKLEYALQNAVENIYQALEGKAQLHCTGKTALNAQVLCKNISALHEKMQLKLKI